MIKYLGSKRRLVPALAAIARAAEARTAVDLFTGTTRVAQAFKASGATVTAVDSARYAHVFARCYIETDARDVDVAALTAVDTARYAEVFARCYIETDAASVDEAQLSACIAGLNDLPGRPGYVTEVFCEEARFFQPANGARIDGIRDAIARE